MAALLVAPGCVSNKQFRANVDDVDRRVAAVESAVEGTDRRIDEVKSDTDRRIASVDNKASDAKNLGDQAMTTATAAEKAAQLTAVARAAQELAAARVADPQTGAAVAFAAAMVDTETQGSEVEFTHGR